MATKKAKKAKKYTKKKPTLDDGGETPITIGGGGGTPLTPFPLTITINPKDWTENPPGTFTLNGGFVKRLELTAGDGLDIDVPIPLGGGVTIHVKCHKPPKSPPR